MTPRRWLDPSAALVLLFTVALLARAASAAPVAAAAPAADAGATPLAGLDAFVEEAMEAWRVPGLAIAVVRDGEVILARGYGVRRQGDPARVDADTLFAIGSSSKAFTAACVAFLVDDKKVEWDDPVTQHLPGFQLHDPYATRELTVRDLLTHRSGLARGDQLWYGSGFDRAEILERVRHLEPSWSFRSRFGYQNLMFLAAGELYAAVAGESWDDCVERRVFAPLQMKRSVTSVDPLPKIDNVATPHDEIDGTVEPVAWRDLDNVAPAGSINSSVREMAAWVELQLDGGRADGGRRVLSEEAVTEMHTPQMVIRKEGSWALYFPASRLITYGLGWFVTDYRGEVVVEHGGSIDGMRALVSTIPERDLGLVVLTNRGGQLLPEVVRYRVYDLLLGLEPEDWSTELLAATKKARDEEEEARAKRERERVADTRPSRALADYAGAYEHPLYGRATVTASGKGLTIERGEFSGDLAHWHFDTFEVRWRDRRMGKPLLSFELDTAGKPVELAIPDLGTFKRIEKAE
jgi:CubicO group peptidase (beta-lactamase class C family)